jgi:hypothetical protein
MNAAKNKLILLSTALALAACSSNDSTDEGKTNPDGGTQEKPLYIIHSGVTQPDNSRMNYFSLVESLDEAKTLDYKDSLEVGGRPRLYAAPGFLAIGSGDAPTITRYTIENNALVEGDSVSFLNEGVASLGAQAVHFVSPTKAYYKDSSQAQIIVWNPSDMSITKTIKLSQDLVKKDGFVTTVSAWAARDGEAYFTVSWSTPDYTKVPAGTVLARINTETDELTTTTDDRCRYLSKTANVDGTLYFFSGVINGFGYAAYGKGEHGQKDCFLRIAPGAKTFDSSFMGSMATALGDGYVGTAIAVTEAGEIWAQVADLAVTPHETTSTYQQWYSKGWSWWHLPLKTLTGAVKVAGEPGAYSGSALTFGSNFYLGRADAQYGTTTLTNMTTGTPVDGIAFPGFSLDVVRVR